MTWVKIAKTDFSGSSAVNVDNVFSASYTHYLVVRKLSGSGTTVADYCTVRMRVSAADDTGTNYRRQRVYATSTTVGGDRGTGETSWLWAAGYTEATAIGTTLLRISNPFEAVRTTGWTDIGQDHTGNIQLVRVVYAHDLTTSYTGFTVTPTGGTITGSITVYGLKES